MSDVQRYDYLCQYEGTMIKAERGEFVAHVEYEKLETQLADTHSALKSIASLTVSDGKSYPRLDHCECILIARDVLKMPPYDECETEIQPPLGERGENLPTMIFDLTDELNALKESQQWQPIESAPKDGTTFWAHDESRNTEQYECYWHKGFDCFWCDELGEVDPNNWQPLPTGPERGGEG